MAMKTCKDLIENIGNKSIEESRCYVTQLIAKTRVSLEGQHGLSSFLQKKRTFLVFSTGKNLIFFLAPASKFSIFFNFKCYL